MRIVLALSLTAACVVGCHRNRVKPLRSDAFYRPGVQVIPPRPAPPAISSVVAPSTVPVVEPTTRPIVVTTPPPGSFATSAPASRPEQSSSSGSYMTLGAVVTEVNGTPIYADKVLATLSQSLAAEAKERDEPQFRKYAQGELKKQVDTQIRAELVFAQAWRNIDQNEKEFANRATEDWRRQQIVQAGGSIENARARAAAEGQVFDDQIKEQYRTYVVQIYRQRHLFPRVQVTADDIRRYYEKNPRQFSKVAKARFRVIKLDAAKIGSPADAEKRANELRKEAAGGADFAELAKKYSHDTRLAKLGGDVGTIERGAYRDVAVEDAAWAVNVGEVAPVVHLGDAFYIVKLEEKQLGETRPFDDEGLQESIKEALRRKQMTEMVSKAQSELVANAIINPYPPVLDSAVEMAMQKYAVWRR